jgi:hypothetical protein
MVNLATLLNDNQEKAHNPQWLYSVLQERISFLDTQLADKYKTGVDIERGMIQRLDNYKSLAD